MEYVYRDQDCLASRARGRAGAHARVRAREGALILGVRIQTPPEMGQTTPFLAINIGYSALNGYKKWSKRGQNHPFWTSFLGKIIGYPYLNRFSEVVQKWPKPPFLGTLILPKS